MSRAYKRMNDITTATAVRGKERETVVSPGVDPLARCNVVLVYARCPPEEPYFSRIIISGWTRHRQLNRMNRHLGSSSYSGRIK